MPRDSRRARGRQSTLAVKFEEETLSDHLINELKKDAPSSQALQAAKDHYFPGISPNQLGQFTKFRQELEAVVNHSVVTCLNGLVRVFEMSKGPVSIGGFQAKIKGALNFYFDQVESLFAIFPDDTKNEVSARSSAYNLALICFLSNAFDVFGDGDVATELDEALSKIELSDLPRLKPAADAPAPSKKLSDFGPVIAGAVGRLFGWQSVNEADQAEGEDDVSADDFDDDRYELTPVEKIFIGIVLVSFDERVRGDRDEVPSDFNGLYCTLSALNVVNHSPDLLEQLLKRGRFTDCSDSNGLTLMILLLIGHQQGDDEEVLLRVIDKLINTLDVSCSVEQRQAYVSSIHEIESEYKYEGDITEFSYQSALTLAYQKGLEKIVQRLITLSPQLAFEHLLLVCDKEKRALSFEEVVGLLNAGLDPSEEVCHPGGKPRSLLFVAAENSIKLEGDVKLMFSLVMLINALYGAFNADGVSVQSALPRGLAAKHEYIRQQLDVIEKANPGVLAVLFEKFIDAESPLLPNFFPIQRAKPSAEQKQLIALMFGADPMLSMLRARGKHGRQRFPTLAIAAQLFAEGFSTDAQPDSYANGCFLKGLGDLQRLRLSMTEGAKTARGEVDRLVLSDKDQRWYARMLQYYGERLAELADAKQGSIAASLSAGSASATRGTPTPTDPQERAPSFKRGRRQGHRASTKFQSGLTLKLTKKAGADMATFVLSSGSENDEHVFDCTSGDGLPERTGSLEFTASAASASAPAPEPAPSTRRRRLFRRKAKAGAEKEGEQRAEGASPTGAAKPKPKPETKRRWGRRARKKAVPEASARPAGGADQPSIAGSSPTASGALHAAPTSSSGAGAATASAATPACDA